MRLATAAAFAGAAIYVSVAEQPARLALNDKAAADAVAASYAHASPCRRALRSASAAVRLAGILADARLALLLGGPAIILANWPYTLLVIMPINKRLEATRAGCQANAADARA